MVICSYSRVLRHLEINASAYDDEEFLGSLEYHFGKILNLLFRNFWNKAWQIKINNIYVKLWQIPSYSFRMFSVNYLNSRNLSLIQYYTVNFFFYNVVSCHLRSIYYIYCMIHVLMSSCADVPTVHGLMSSSAHVSADHVVHK